MQRLKKAFLFILGIVTIPVILGKFLSWIVGCEDYKGINFFWISIFLDIYHFPFFISRKNKRENS